MGTSHALHPSCGLDSGALQAAGSVPRRTIEQVDRCERAGHDQDQPQSSPSYATSLWYARLSVVKEGIRPFPPFGLDHEPDTVLRAAIRALSFGGSTSPSTKSPSRSSSKMTSTISSSNRGSYGKSIGRIGPPDRPR